MVVGLNFPDTWRLFHMHSRKNIKITCALEIMGKSVVYAAIITENF